VLTLLSASSGPFISFYEETMQMRVFGVGLYSHVGFGRYMGFVFLVSLINLMYFGFFKKYSADKVFLIVSFAGLALSGLRGAVTSSLVIAVILIFYTIRKKNISKSFSRNVSLLKLFSVLAGGLLLLTGIVYFNNSFHILFSRFIQMFNVFDVKNLTDGAIQTRLHIYGTSFDIFKQNIFFGRGLGSYFDESLFIYTKGLKYPHNIFIEYGIELGIAGLIFIFSLLFIIYKAALKVNILLSFIFLYFLLLAMFSYSIPFQTGLFSFIAFINLKEENIKMLRNVFNTEE